MKIDVVGSVSFANTFIPLFQAHPLVAELDPAKRSVVALRAGKHVFCAVPMAQSLEEIVAVVDGSAAA